MDLCAYCGRRLPLLHRIAGSSRFCSKRHAELYAKEQDQLAVEALSRLRPAADPPPRLPLQPTAPAPEPIAETSRTPEEQVPAPASLVPDPLIPVTAAPLSASPLPEFSGQATALPSISVPAPAPPAPDRSILTLPPPRATGTLTPPLSNLSPAAPALPSLPTPQSSGCKPPLAGELLSLPMQANSAGSQRALAGPPLPPRRRLFAPAFPRAAASSFLLGPRAATDLQLLATPPALAPVQQAAQLAVSPLAGPPDSCLPAGGSAPAEAGPAPAAACPLPLAGLAPQARQMQSPPAEHLLAPLTPAIPSRRFRVSQAAAIPPLSLYEGPEASPSPSPLRAWGPHSSLPSLLRRAARVPVRALSQTLRAPGFGPLARAAATQSALAPPHCPTSPTPSSLFVPKALVLPARPCCAFGPLPSARPAAAASKPTGAVIPIRAAAGRRPSPVLK